MVTFKLLPGWSRGFFALIVLLALSAELCDALPNVAATTTKKTTKKTSTTKTTTSTTPTKTTTTTSKTTTSKTTKSTSSKPLYTWRSASPRTGCPSWTTTQSSVSQTFSADTSAATVYLDPYTGNVLNQLAAKTENGDDVIFRTFNSSMIQLFKPGHFVMLVDNNGPAVFDEKCQSGARLFIPNFFSSTGGSAAAKRSVFEEGSTLSKLSRRGGTTKAAGWAWTFVDECGYRLAENITGASSVLSCDCVDEDVLRSERPSTYSPAIYRGQSSVPATNLTLCKSKSSEMYSYFTSSEISNVLSGPDFSNALPQIGAKSTADPDAAAILQDLGSAVDLSTLSQALRPLRGMYNFFHGGAPTSLQNLICYPDYRLEVTVDTLHFGKVKVVDKPAPFSTYQPTPTPVTLPTKIHQVCKTTYSASHAYSNLDCQIPTPAPAVVAQKCPATTGDPQDPCAASRGTACGLQQSGDAFSQCICFKDYLGNPMCYKPSSYGDCRLKCSSHADCPCGKRCSWSATCCGGSVCVNTAPCYHSDYDGYYDYYYSGQLTKRVLSPNISESEYELLTRQVLGPPSQPSLEQLQRLKRGN